MIVDKIMRSTRTHLSLQLQEAKDTIHMRLICSKLGIEPRWKTRTYSSWLRPEENEIMTNTDGSVMLNRSGCGGIIRDREGIVRLMYTGNGNDSSILSQELHGILAGLEGSLLIQEHRATVCSDSQRAVMMLNGKENPPWYLTSIVNRIKHKMGLFSKIGIVHQVRESKRDLIAKLDNDGSNCILYFLNPIPLALQTIIDEDANGILYPRFK